MELISEYIVALKNLYGIVHKRKVMEIYNQQNKNPVTIEEIDTIMMGDALKSYHVHIHDDYFVEESILLFGDFDLEMEKKKGKPYFIPSKNELLKYKDQFYIDKNKQYHALSRYLAKKFLNGNIQKADELCENANGMLQAECSVTQIISELNRFDIIFDNEEQAKEVFKLVIDLSNHTRLWSNNGYTPSEIAGVAGSFGGNMPFMTKTSHTDRPDLSVIPGGTKKKVGRNEPCPCGSGKKYKKCCMNKE